MFVFIISTFGFVIYNTNKLKALPSHVYRPLPNTNLGRLMIFTQPYTNNICVLSNCVPHCIMNRKCCLSLNGVFGSVILGGLSTNIILLCLSTRANNS